MPTTTFAMVTAQECIFKADATMTAKDIITYLKK